jgi:hypothetical protein
MDSSFSIKPPPAVAQSRALRDPVPVRGAADTELSGERTVNATNYNGDRRGQGQHGDARQDSKDGEPRTDHAPQDLVADPDSRDVIYRARDVRSLDREHPDDALMRLRAYRPSTAEAAPASSDDPHADIQA